MRTPRASNGWRLVLIKLLDYSTASLFCHLLRLLILRVIDPHRHGNPPAHVVVCTPIPSFSSRQPVPICAIRGEGLLLIAAIAHLSWPIQSPLIVYIVRSVVISVSLIKVRTCAIFHRVII